MEGVCEGRLDLVQSDMTTVIEDCRQEPPDEERLCASAECVPMHSLNTALLCLRRPRALLPAAVTHIP